LRRIRFAVFRQEFYAADAGKDALADDEVIRSALEKLERRFGAVRDVHFITFFGEDPLERLTEGVLIFHYKESFSHDTCRERKWNGTAVPLV